jgi:hypothetical protein
VKLLRKTIVKPKTALVFTVAFLICFVQLPVGHSEETIEQEVGLGFLENVVRLDVSKYTVIVKVGTNPPLPAPAPGLFKDRVAKFNMTSAESKVDVLMFLRNDQVIWYTLNAVRGSPAFIKPTSSDTLDIAKDTLNKIQDYTPNEHIPIIQTMLNNLTELKESQTTNSDFTQEITIQSNTVTIEWIPYLNGLSHPKNSMILTFENGHLTFFHNGFNLYSIGSSEVKIEEQEAIEIAKESASAYPLKYGNGTISNFTILDDPVLTKISLQNKGNTTLYPMWEVWLPLDDMYAGGVTAFHVFVWADTGEVSSITPIGFSGIPPTQDQTSLTEQKPDAFVTIPVSVASFIAAVAIVTAIISLLIFRRHRKTASLKKVAN